MTSESSSSAAAPAASALPPCNQNDVGSLTNDIAKRSKSNLQDMQRKFQWLPYVLGRPAADWQKIRDSAIEANLGLLDHVEREFEQIMRAAERIEYLHHMHDRNFQAVLDATTVEVMSRAAASSSSSFAHPATSMSLAAPMLDDAPLPQLEPLGPYGFDHAAPLQLLPLESVVVKKELPEFGSVGGSASAAAPAPLLHQFAKQVAMPQPSVMW